MTDMELKKLLEAFSKTNDDDGDGMTIDPWITQKRIDRDVDQEICHG